MSQCFTTHFELSFDVLRSLVLSNLDRCCGKELGQTLTNHVALSGCHGIVASPGQGIAPWHAALTDSDVVTVGDAPVTVDLISLLRPVMRTTLFGSCLINEVCSDWTAKDARNKCSNDDCCKNVTWFDHLRVLWCVRCPSPLGAMLSGGFDPPASRLALSSSCNNPT